MTAPVAAFACVAVMVAGCTDRDPVGPSSATEIASIRFTAHVSAAVEGVSVEISATDIDPPAIHNLPVTDGVASGTIGVTTGFARLVTVRAFDVRGVETHAGTATIDVLPVGNVQLAITLEPVSGDVPIVVELATYLVTLDPPSAALGVDETLQLTATVEDGGGNPVVNPEIAWGSTAPDVASVDQAGFVIAVAPGTATIVANYRGTAALVAVTVT